MKSDGNGRVSATKDAPMDIQWGGMDSARQDEFSNFGTSAKFFNIGGGMTNTQILLNETCDSTGGAFSYVDTLNLGGYDDWFLPSPDELDLMWNNIADSDGDGDNSGASDPNNIGDFKNTEYWSSTAYRTKISAHTQAWTIRLDTQG